MVPPGYLFPAECADLAAKLRALYINVRTLDRALRAENEVVHDSKNAQDPAQRLRDDSALDGAFSGLQVKEFPAGAFMVDLAQPMANAAFYYLEPQARDGFVGWGLLDDALRNAGVERGPVEYPIFKFRREVSSEEIPSQAP